MGAMIDLGEGSVAQATLVGAAGASSVEVTTYGGVRMFAGGAELTFAPIKARATGGTPVFQMHGTFGNDILRHGTVVIDPVAGVFEYR
jgi:hypothetical protein